MGTPPCMETPPPKVLTISTKKINVVPFSDIIMDIHTVYALWEKKEILSLLGTQIHIPISVYGMETGIFPVYGMKPGNFSGLRNKNLNFSGIFWNSGTRFGKFPVSIP